MASHTELPVYKLCYDLLGLASDFTRNMPRDFKSTFGAQIRKECVELLVLIGRANAAEDKVPYLSRLLERLQVVELLMRLSTDKQFISPKQWARSIDLTDRIGKQVGGWRKASLKRAASPAT